MQKESVNTRALVQLYVELTNACNLHCKHCYLSAGERHSRILQSRILHELLADFSAMGGQAVSFSGGEPLLHPGWRPSVRLARFFSLETIFISNGTLLLQDDIEFLLDLGSRIGISLDGASPAIHDAVRGEGSFEKTLAAVDAILKLNGGESLVLCFTPMAITYRELPKLIELADALGIQTVYLSFLENRGRALQAIDSLGLDLQGRKELLYSIFILKQKFPNVHIDCPNLRFFIERLQGMEIEAGNLDHTLRVTCRGDVYLTAYLDDERFYLGRYMPGELERIWRSQKCAQSFGEAEKFAKSSGECRRCSAWDCCRAGSAALTWLRNGSFKGVDSFCAAKQALWDECVRPVH